LLETTSPDLTKEVLEFLRQRLENHSFSITYVNFPVTFAKGVAAASESEIFIPTPSNLEPDSLEVCYAMNIHESGHVLFGSCDFTRVEREIKKFAKPGLGHAIYNIIEDYRINVLIGVTHPGAGRILDAVHRRIVKSHGAYTNAFDALLPELCGYPYDSKLEKKEQEKLKKACDIIYGVVTCPNLDATIKLVPNVYPIFEDDWTEPPTIEEGYGEDEGDEGEDGDGDAESTGSSGGSSDSSSASASGATSGKSRATIEKHPSLSKGEKEEKLKEAVKKLSKELEKEGTTPKEMSEKKKEEKEGDLKKSKEYEDIRTVFEEAKKIQAKASEKEAKKKSELKSLESDFSDKYGKDFSHEIERNESKERYKRFEKLYQRPIERLVKDAKTVFLFARGYHTGLRTGKLNGKKAYRLVTSGDSRIFKKKTDNKNVGEIAVCLLVDCSGSMHGEKIEDASKSSIVLHEVFRRLKIKHMIVGYTADIKRCGVTHHIIYKHWDDGLPSYNLASMRARAENRDGASIRMATSYLKTQPERRKLLIVVSDGYPCAYRYNGEEGLKDTIKAHHEAQKMGIKLINIGIGSRYDLPKEYENKVKVDDINKLPETFMKVLRREMLS
jgi:cobaltochelatase CobT